MNYRSYMEQVMKLPFIKDEVMAHTAAKTVLGMLASKLGEQEARRFTEMLPSQFDFVTLLGHQHTPNESSVEEMIGSVATQLRLANYQEGSDLVMRVFHCVKEDPQGAEMMRQFGTILPPDWADLIDRA